MFKRRRSKTQSPHNSVGSGGSANKPDKGGGGSDAAGSAAGSGGGGSDDGSSAQNSPSIPRGCIRLPSGGLPSFPTSGNGSNGTLTVSLEGNECNSHLTTSTATHKSRSRRRRAVRFRHVVVREFERVIGDNPSCSGGAPISYVCVMQTRGAERKRDECSLQPSLI
jgi:hypothetical protein